MNKENLTRYIVLVPHKDSLGMGTLKPLPLHLAIVEEALPAAHLKLIAEKLRQKADIEGALQGIPHIKQLLTGTSTIDCSIPHLLLSRTWLCGLYLTNALLNGRSAAYSGHHLGGAA